MRRMLWSCIGLCIHATDASGAHARLEQRIRFFRKQLDEPGRSVQEKNHFRVDLDIAERALVYFRRAYELEQKISNDPRQTGA